MPLHVQLNLPPARALTIDDYEPSFATYLHAAWGDGNNNNFGTITNNMLEASELRYGYNVRDVAEAGGLTGGVEKLREAEPLTPWGMEEQKAYIKKEGLEGQLSPGEHYTREELEFLAQLKHEEIDRKLIREKAPAWMAPFGFLVELAASLTDPLNLVTSLVPVIPEARVMQLLAKAKSAWGRGGVRAGVTAAEGAVGAAVVEPLVLAGKTELQQEYDLTGSLVNILFSAVQKPVTGGLGDWIRQKKGLRQPWEYVPSSDRTEKLRSENAAGIWAGMKASGVEKPDSEHAGGAAALWDATLRGYAYDTGELVGDAYAGYRTEWRGSRLELVDMRGDTLNQAMYPARETDIPAFVERVSQEGQAAKKSYFSWKGQDEFEGWEIRLPSDTVFHQKKRHPDMTDADNAKLPRALHSLEDVEPSARGTGIYGTAFLARARVDGQGYGIVLEANRKGQIFVTTFFKDSDSALEAWLEREKKKAPRVPAASETESALSPGVGPGGPVQEKIQALLVQVKSDSEKAQGNVSQKEGASTSTNTGGSPGVMPRPLKEDELRVPEALEDAEPSASSQKILRKTASDGNSFSPPRPHPAQEKGVDVPEQPMQRSPLSNIVDTADQEDSDGMRELSGGMTGTAEDGDISFRYAMGKLLDYSPEKAIDTRVELPVGDAENITDAHMLEAHAREAKARLNEAFDALADMPDAREHFHADLEADMAEADAAVAEVQRRGEIMRAAARIIR